MSTGRRHAAALQHVTRYVTRYYKRRRLLFLVPNVRVRTYYHIDGSADVARLMVAALFTPEARKPHLRGPQPRRAARRAKQSGHRAVAVP